MDKKKMLCGFIQLFLLREKKYEFRQQEAIIRKW